jgi:hypothetical protein
MSSQSYRGSGDIIVLTRSLFNGAYKNSFRVKNVKQVPLESNKDRICDKTPQSKPIYNYMLRIYSVLPTGQRHTGISNLLVMQII